MDFSKFDPATFAGVDDASVRSFAIPPYGFVRNWIQYASPLTEAPLAYHLGVALSLVATVVPTGVFLPDGDDLHANMFVMLVGPSSRGRKTFSVELGSKLLMETAGSFFMSDDGSTEGFADEIIRNPRRLIVSPEGGQFLAHTVGGKYGHEIRKRLTSLFDCSPVQRNTASKIKAKENFIQVDPRVSMLIAATKSDLETYTLLPDWTGGFLSRYCMIWGSPERSMARAGRDPEGRAFMKGHLLALAQVQSVGVCGGFTPAAAAYFDNWQKQIPSKTVNERASGVVDRAQLHARKAALVLAYDRHTYRWASAPDSVSPGTLEQPFLVDLPDVAVGCALGNFHIASAMHLVTNIADNEHGRIMRRIVNFLQTRGGAALYGEILREVDLPAKTVVMYLETLASRDEIVVSQGGLYSLATGRLGQYQVPPKPVDPFNRRDH